MGSTAEEPMVCMTLRWRGLDSNFQHAGAVKLVVAPFLAPACLRRDGSRWNDPPAAIGAPKADTNRGFRVGRSISDAKPHVGVFVADSNGRKSWPLSIRRRDKSPAASCINASLLEVLERFPTG